MRKNEVRKIRIVKIAKQQFMKFLKRNTKYKNMKTDKYKNG